MTPREIRLELTKHHVAEARRLVKYQKQAIEQNKRAGRDTSDSEARLTAFERALSTFEDRLAAVLAETG